ncbi:glucose-6-phosphate 1-dehydrogenase 6, cytoplasmic-like [Hibiscus syriacus]|uniref:glucose-6-phosphate 1-dehydrogenase 6, cytoplasmic-like n=1 Tax=Hibiscus syriacus TaxID=106335 RepID=UPI0019246100|nr:glucose-6-phosphate 1-dehydrogenase 6, cytoplasmic-like [Hibiscus syriacus]
MGSGEWFLQKRDSFRNDSFSGTENVPEIGCLSIIVLGASGDLAKKTFPAPGISTAGRGACFRLCKAGYLVTERSSLPSEDVSKFLQLIKYVSGTYAAAEGFQLLDKEIMKHEISKSCQKGSSRILFYLALPPSVYPSRSVSLEGLVAALVKSSYGGHQGRSSGGTVENKNYQKPFNKDLGSADELSSQIGELFNEPQIYHIDHYLGKELVQNLLVLRLANRFFLPLWNRGNIDNVQIVFREDFGTEGRGGYFDEYGIIRDIIQNHLLQVLCLVAMEKPVSLKPEHIRMKK